MAQQTQVSVRLLRYYEEQGLIRPNRTASGQRLYSTEEVERVTQIRRLLAAGLGTERIRDLLPCFDAPPHKRTAYLVDSLQSERLRIDNAIQALTTVRAALDQLIDSSDK
jgi:DNA-binding transcriptional MerR regulator